MPDALVDTANVAMIAHPVTEVLENEGMMFCMFFFWWWTGIVFGNDSSKERGVFRLGLLLHVLCISARGYK